MADRDTMAEVQMQRLRRDQENSPVIFTMLVFTLMMVSLPITFYFLSKSYVFETYYGMSSNDSYFYAAIVAVVTVHFVLAMFIYVAWNEGTRQSTIKID